MKIAFLHFWTLRMRRGVETLVLSLANELAERGHVVSIVTARQTQAPLVIPAPQVKVKAFPTFRYFSFLTIVPFYALDLIRSQYDIVVVFFADFGEGAAFQFASRFIQPRLFVYLTFPHESAPHRYRAYQRWGWDKRADWIAADAAYTARIAEPLFQRSIRVLPSGTNPERFQPDAEKRATMRRELGLRDDEIVLLNVSALEERKGVWRVIETLPQIRAQCPQVRYVILGQGAHRATLERRVAELGLDSSVIFAGTTADLVPAYNAADIFVMLPDSEAGSVACLEAMACGLPAVVSNTGGFAEVVSDANGRIVDLNDSTAIADAIIELAQDADVRARLGRAARARVIEKFSWQRIAEQFERICHE